MTFDANLANTDVVNGGDGTDTVSTYALLQALTNATAATDNVSNFENVTFTTAFNKYYLHCCQCAKNGHSYGDARRSWRCSRCKYKYD